MTRNTRISFVIIAVAFIAMIAWTWGRWCDPIVDFGRELYVPWRVSQGKFLYRDIAHFNGPFSVYFNALMFRTLGVSLRTIEITNIAIAGAVVVMIWKLARRATRSELASTIASLLFITLFMPIQLVEIGNYNWITPYSHELTHGIALSLLALTMLASNQARQRGWKMFVIGLLLGLIVLTKVEVTLAAVPAIIAGILLARRRALLPLCAGIVIPVAIAFVLFGRAGVIDPWRYAIDSRLASLPFYRQSIGLHAPFRWIDFSSILGTVQRIFGVLLLTSAAIAGWTVLRASRRNPRSALRVAIALFALLLLAKVALNVRIYHYGFALAMPAMLVTIAALLAWSRSLMRSIALCLVALVIGVHLYVYATRFRDKPVVIASDRADSFRAPPRGELVNELVRALDTLPPNTTVAVLPQGAMVNYLAQRANPTPFITLMPPEVIMFGGSRIADAYAKSPPDVIVLIDTDLAEYGYKSFDEVAPELIQWMRENYEMARVIASPSPELPGARILRKRL